MPGYNKNALLGFTLTLASILIGMFIPQLFLYPWLGGIALGFVSYKQIQTTHEKGIYMSYISIASLLYAILMVIYKITVISSYKP